MTTTDKSRTTQINRVYIRATPEAVWDAITKPEWTERYGYGGRVEIDLSPGGAFRAVASKEMVAAGMPEVPIEGEVIEVDPPRKLVQTWSANWNDEPPTRLTYEIEASESGVTKLTVTHDLDGAPETAAMVSGEVENAGGGWSKVLSDLKTLLETGRSFEEK